MTEHESEQLYRDLQRKLEGYGSAPPETVWAGIRKQVPARQPRNWRPLLLLLLLAFVVATIKIGADYQHPFRATGAGISRASRPATEAAGYSTSRPVRSAATLANPVGPVAGSASPTGPADTPSTPPRTEAVRAIADANGTQTPAATARRKSAPAWLPGIITIPRRQPPPRLTASSRETRNGQTTRRQRRAATLVGLASRRRTPFGPGREAASRNASRSVFGRRSRAGLQLTAHTAVSTSTDASLDATSTDRHRTGTRTPEISNEPLALLTVRPPVLEPAEPEVHTKRRARRQPTKQELRLRNWSAQLLLGSGLTYRFLGGTPTQLERLERPGLGFSGQATAGYSFSRQLTVTAGLGYAEFANTLNYKLKKDSLETLQQQNFRDVYHFLTIPMQAQLTLQGNHRWRYGVLGGGTVAVLTGARTTEGSACNCRQQQWTTDAVNLPFRRISLALTGGVFASYQLQPGQWLTVQPQAQIFLNSLSNPAGTRAPRRPWSTGMQLGYSWDLEPRKR